MKIFTIGIGSAEGTLVQIPDGNGGSDYIRDEKGQVVKTKLNETLLQQIATAAGGFYLPLRGANTMDTLYERGLAPLPKSESKEKLVRRYHEQFQWPLAAAMVLLMAEIFLPERRSPARRETGGKPTPAANHGGGAVIALALLPAAAKASPRRRCAIITPAISRTRSRNIRSWRRCGRMICGWCSTRATRRIARRISTSRKTCSSR